MVWVDVREKSIWDIYIFWQDEIQHAIAVDVAELPALKDGFAAAVAMRCFRNPGYIEYLIPEAFLHDEAPRGDEKRKQH